MKIATIVGARPQFVKAAAFSRIAATRAGCEEILIHTGQHYDANMSDVFFSELKIPPPRHHLGVGSGRHGAQTGKMMELIEDILLQEKPNVVLIYGDTNSTLAGALAAVKLHIPVAHVEAGLRSFNRAMPEEINRIVADSVSDVLFAPTWEAVAQLKAEGISGDKVVWSGDIMYDMALLVREIALRSSPIIRDLALKPKGYYLATIHRAENTDDPQRLAAIVQCLELVGREMPVVLPLHPRTRAALTRQNLLEPLARAITITEPLGFVDMVRLELDALAVVTDSGGVQKEAFFYRIPCFVLRNETEWVELIEAGWNTLVPPADPTGMARVILDLQNRHPREISPYGDGNAATIIADELIRRFNG
jgi:UDP-GlcNAc3NAcA epimerase